MDRKLVYDKTADYIRGKWVNLILILAGIWGINFVVGLLLGGTTAASTMTDAMNSIQYGGSDGEISFQVVNSMISGMRRNWLRGIIQATISSMLTAGFTMALLDSFRRDVPVAFEAIFDYIRKYAMEILVASLVIGVVETVVGIIPIIGAIISTILTYMFTYVFFIIKEDEEDVISSIKRSVELTRGHKMNLFIIDLYYLFRPLLAMVLIPIGAFIVQDLFAVGLLLMIAGLIGGAVLGIRYIPYTHVARTIYYAETNSFDDVTPADEFEAVDEFDEFDDFDDFDGFDE